MNRQCTQEQFLKDVANHKMIVNLDQGVYRHIVFEQPTNSFHHRFEIVTTPHRLMITGDMGTWVFARIKDMFEFFRTKDGGINRSYWAEKLQNGARGCSDSAKVYDGDAYKERVIEHLDNYDLRPDDKAEVLESLDSLDFDDEHQIICELRDFEVGLGGGEEFTFQDVWEIDMKVHSYHFIWCCYAIAWGIRKYDELERAK